MIRVPHHPPSSVPSLSFLFCNSNLHVSKPLTEVTATATIATVLQLKGAFHYFESYQKSNMMDFEDAAQRLKRDQKKIRGRKPVVVSEKAKKQAEYQRKQRARMQAERERKRRLEEYQQQYMKSCDRALRVQSLGSKNTSLFLQPTSIHGNGDKLSLPPSVLEHLTSEMGDSMGGGNPWTFRIAIPNPDYNFPSSPLVHTLKPPAELDGGGDDDSAMSDSEDENDNGDGKAAYLDELAHKYLAYTHCTVVEFTQDEGCVGIPQPIAQALLDSKNRLPAFQASEIPTTRTVDPSLPASKTDDEDNNDLMDTENAVEDPSSATPGHVAYGAFDIPNVPLEITMVRLPKGRGCTLVPTKDAVKHGFYGLKDVKLVLEQSLIRTRATLSLGDVVSTWHRGVQFDLKVTKILPSAYQGVTCINTDIEVDIGESKQERHEPTSAAASSKSSDQALGTGHVLGGTTLGGASSTAIPPPLSSSHTVEAPGKSIVLRPEPTLDQSDGIVHAQVRFAGGNGKRRFDINVATVRDLLDFGASLVAQDPSRIRLVTRFPRRVFALVEGQDTTSAVSQESTLAAAGISAGQELFLVEMI